MSKLDKLKQQREELDKQIKALAAQAAKQNRENDRDRKIIFGAWCMKHRQELLKEFMANLSTPREKALFENWTPPAPAENRAPYPAQKVANTAPTPTAAPAPKLQAAGG